MGGDPMVLFTVGGLYFFGYKPDDILYLVEGIEHVDVDGVAGLLVKGSTGGQLFTDEGVNLFRGLAFE